ncbi:hypothetical protein BT93_J0949 [Corymbia citriodora subsp. variegata]|nr:hypothetical protein BT93_J0949 [Corymbia citriodora subsp. variegata]
MLSPETLYVAYLVFKFTPMSYGFEYQPIQMGAGFVGDESSKRERLIHLYREDNMLGWQSRPRFRHAGGSLTLAPAEGSGNHHKERQDGWSEIELGELLTKEGEDVEVEVSVIETKGCHWKAGLVVEGVKIRPKDGK